MVRRRFRGFTLIELLAVITVIGILATLAAVGISNASKRARDARRKSDMAAMKSALEVYNQDTGSYPVVAGALGNATAALAPLVPNYIAKVPVDPKNTVAGNLEYSYASDGSNYVVTGGLEYGKEASVLAAPAACGGSLATSLAYATKGNGVVSAAAPQCFRVTND